MRCRNRQRLGGAEHDVREHAHYLRSHAAQRGQGGFGELSAGQMRQHEGGQTLIELRSSEQRANGLHVAAQQHLHGL